MKRLLNDIDERGGKITTGFAVAILILVNFFLLWPLFRGGFTGFFGSIECVFLADARFIVENFPHINFYPFWYMGFPFYLTYQPVVPYGLAFGHLVTHLPVESIYRICLAVFYTLGSISLYFLIQYLVKNRLIALIGALVYTFVPSVGYFIGEVRGIGEVFNFLPWRMIAMYVYGEGPHIWGLAFIPLALLFILKLFNQPSRINWCLAILFTVLILLTSLTAFLAYLVFLAMVIIGQICLGQIRKKLYISSILALFSLGLSVFWYNWSFIKAALIYSTGEGGGIVSGIYGNPTLVLSLSIPFLAIFVVFIAPLFKRGNFYLWFLGLGSFLVLFLSIAFWYKYRVALIPLPYRSIPRFIPELEMALGLFLAILLAWLYKRIACFSRILGYGLLLIILLILLAFIPSRREYFAQMLQPNSDYQKTSEYQIAQWLSQNSNGERIYATGTHAFWLNVFSDVPQLRGGKGGDFGGLNPFWAHLTYQIYYGEDGELAVNWLKALGMKYIIVNLPESQVTYHDFKNPFKFDDYLTKEYQYQGDIIYSIPTQHTGLVLKVKKADLAKAGTFWDAKEGKATLDKERLLAYLNATELSQETTDLSYNYTKPWDQLEIDPTNINAQDDILVRISYHPGWRAYQDGKRLKIEKDPLGFILIDNPQPSGEIILKFSPTKDVYLGYLITILSFIGLAIFLSHPYKKFAVDDKKKVVELDHEDLDKGA